MNTYWNTRYEAHVQEAAELIALLNKARCGDNLARDEFYDDYRQAAQILLQRLNRRDLYEPANSQEFAKAVELLLVSLVELDQMQTRTATRTRGILRSP